MCRLRKSLVARVNALAGVLFMLYWQYCLTFLWEMSLELIENAYRVWKHFFPCAQMLLKTAKNTLCVQSWRHFFHFKRIHNILPMYSYLWISTMHRLMRVGLFLLEEFWLVLYIKTIFSSPCQSTFFLSQVEYLQLSLVALVAPLLDMAIFLDIFWHKLVVLSFLECADIFVWIHIRFPQRLNIFCTIFY